jgi:hypothetical protein
MRKPLEAIDRIAIVVADCAAPGPPPSLDLPVHSQCPMVRSMTVAVVVAVQQNGR